MAHYGYGMKEPTYGAAMVGYSATSESYVASTERVMKLGGYPYPATHGQVSPRSSTHIQPKKGDDYDHDYSSPKFSHVTGSTHDSPRKTFHRANSPPSGHDLPRKTFHRANSPPPGHYSGMYDTNLNRPHDSPRKNLRDNRGSFSSTDDDSSGDDVECRDGVCNPKPKHGGNGQDYKKANGYGASNYPSDHQPRNESRHQTSDPRNYYNTEKLPETNNIYSPNSYNNHTKPVIDAYYDRLSYPPNNEHNRNNHTLPAPIKTRPEYHRDAKSSPVAAATHWTPFGASPRKEQQGKQKVIDSTEAHRRYDNAPPQSNDKYNYKGTIDSKTAAKMYGGVFVK